LDAARYAAYGAIAASRARESLDKPALRDFVRECVKEQRAKQKLPE